MLRAAEPNTRQIAAREAEFANDQNMSKRNRDIDDKEPVSGKNKRNAECTSHSRELTHNDYTVGWVCALPKEQTAATAMLDQIHYDLPKPSTDHNTYTLGSIGRHNIVIVCSPKGKYGTNSASAVATRMVGTFPSIKVGLMVGIGGGIPPKVRLGDVVVSTPVDQFPGVVQWDMGKAEEGGSFKRTGALNNPPSALLTALTKLETKHDMCGSKIPQYLDGMGKRWPRLVAKYTRPDSLNDPLSSSDSSSNRPSQPREVRVHYGLIASGNQVIKEANFRDSLNESLGGNVLCVEMEAAGLMNDFPCVVIRGICDHADSQKNKDWQEYAAAIAAAYAKELLECVQASDVDGERPVKDILAEVLDTVRRTEGNIETMRFKLDRKEDLEVLNWLTSVDYGPPHSDFLKRRQPGTGRWLLDSPEYQTWLSLGNQTLFCPGIPGAGKTILTAIVIDDLTMRFLNNQSIGIAYIYCNFRRQNEQRVEDLLASLLKQLSWRQPSLPDSVRDLCTRHKDKGTRPSLREISDVLQLLAAKYLRAFILIDALDECDVSSGCQTRLLTEIFHLHALCRVNIFATSRFVPQITERFNGSIMLEIRACDEDVREYLRAQILESGSTFLLSHNEEIQNSITEIVDGMFLLAHLHFESVKPKKTIRKVREAIASLPKGYGAYNHAYEDAMQRIEKQDMDSQQLAKDVLSWIVCAKRPLTTSELQHALAVEASDDELDEDNLPLVEDMVSVCAGLVTVDEESGIIRLVHYTTQEYFQQTQQKWFPDAESDITRICTSYLSFCPFESGLCQSFDELKERLQSNKLYHYSANNWGHHARKALTLCPEVIAFLNCEVKVDASIQVLDGFPYTVWFPYHTGIQLKTGMTGLHLAAYLGVEEAVKALLFEGVKKPPGDQTTPEAKLDSKDQYGQTPLLWAVKHGHEAVVKQLLKKGADLESKDKRFGQTPLSWAAKHGHEAVIKQLLEKGADLESKDQYGQTPLSWAAKHGHEAEMQQLVEQVADIPVRDKNIIQALTYWAAKYGHEEAVEQLLKKGALTWPYQQIRPA
ncbi:hypothetical protein KXW97_003527 [Aspergillus fumigatus]|nr:hypothetical protein KXW97_003527 [Aspergillus fumigatus]KAH3550125.1 hypothetical protein KXW20_003817 [Aspergillus fumigatus]